MKDPASHEVPHITSLSLGFEEDEKLSRYVLEKEIGSGGFGTVYLATDNILERQIAIKVLKPEVSKIAEAAGAAFDEARVLATLEHPHIVPVYDAGKTESGEIFIVSKYIEGITLEDALKRGDIDQEAFLEKVVEIASGLETVHQLNLSHQDVKPTNILLDNEQKAILIDFGIARFLGASKWFHSAGTPEYMSPEQTLGQDHLVDSQADIYALGAILFRGLTGSPVKPEWIEEESWLAFERQISGQLRESALKVPPNLVNIILKALAFQKTKRYKTVRSLREDLEGFFSVEKVSHSSAPPSQLVHRGLRAFNEDDSGPFLELLPGPREPNSGLPLDIDQWKRRIEDVGSSSETPLRIGIIYGPSGSGKSSLLHAGIVPQLRDSVITLQLNASKDSTESLLKQKLTHRFSHLDQNDELPWMLRKLRLGGLPVGSKLLIVIDQFEQWLQADTEQRSARFLARALRQCDGFRIQAVLVVREEFWRGTSQLMQELDIPMRQGENITLCTPFDRDHTRFVIEKIAGTFPQFTDLSNRRQRSIVQHGLSLIEDQGRFPPVHIAILIQILEQNSWEYDVISRIKNLEDLGIFYLNTIFKSSSLRTRRDTAEAFLLTLVPEQGLIRKEAISEAELLKATNLENDPVAFEELVHALDQDLRLISPAPKDGGRAYLLSHDYLVGALRNWTLNTQNKTLRGFAQSRLRTQATIWISGDRKKLLPGVAEWAWLKVLTTGRRRTLDDEKYLSSATRHHVPRLILVSFFSLILGITAWSLVARQRADEAVDRLLEARPKEIQSAIRTAEAGLFWNKDRLEDITTSDANPGNRWRALLPLIKDDPGLKKKILDPLMVAQVSEVSVMTETLHPLELEIKNDLIHRVLNEESPSTGLRAACALARAKVPDSFWKEQANRIAAWYTQEKPDPQWVDLLSTIAPYLEESMLQQLKSGNEPAAQFLATIYAHDQERLRKYIAVAKAEQLPALLESLTDLKDLGDLPKSKEVVPRANAIIAQLSFESAPLPAAPEEAELNSHVLARGSVLETRRLAQHLEAAADSPTWLRIFCLLLSQKDPELLNPTIFEEVKTRAEHIARSHPSGSVHAASRFLLANWKCEVPKSLPPEDAQWNYHPLHDLTMTILEPAVPLKLGAKRFEICSIELTTELFRILDDSGPGVDRNWKEAIAPRNGWQAMAFCNKLSRAHNMTPCYEAYSENESRLRPKEDYLNIEGFRLPTRDEWQYACSGPPQSLYSFGSSDLEIVDLFAWVNGRTVEPQTVGTLFPNRHGLYDMHGNLAEYCLNPFPFQKDQPNNEMVLALMNSVSAPGGTFNTPLKYAHIEDSGIAIGNITNPNDLITVRFARTVTSSSIRSE